MIWMLAAIAVCAALSIAFWKRYRARSSRRTEITSADEGSFARSYSRATSGISFRDAIHFARFGEQISGRLLSEVNSHLTDGASDALIVGLEVVNSAQARDLILARFPSATAQLLEQESAVQLVTKNGEKLLIAVDKNGRRFISQAKQIDPSAVSRIANIGALIVGTAHIISGYDNAKKIGRIDKKVDLQIELLGNDLSAQLEAIYESLKERLAAPDSGEYKNHLFAMKHQLKELRCRWFLNMESNLKTMTNPSERGFLTKLFSRKKSSNQKIILELANHQEPLHLIRFAIQMEQVIAEVLGESHGFYRLTVPDVQSQIRELSKLVDERREWIVKYSSESTPNELVAACERLGKSLP